MKKETIKIKTFPNHVVGYGSDAQPSEEEIYDALVEFSKDKPNIIITKHILTRKEEPYTDGKYRECGPWNTTDFCDLIKIENGVERSYKTSNKITFCEIVFYLHIYYQEKLCDDILPEIERV